MKPVLQYRWQLVEEGDEKLLVYYGLRLPPNNARQLIKLSDEAYQAIRGMDGDVDWDNYAASPVGDELADLRELGAIVDVEDKAAPGSVHTCTKCVNNDAVLPGLEFDENGICAFCRCYEAAGEMKPSYVSALSEDELKEAARNNTESRFDAMVLFTGGKDSSFLLWHLAKNLGLRVMAAFWDMPYTQDEARANMERAKKKLPEVEFVQWSLPWNVVKKAMRGQMGSMGCPCLCPTAAFPLFYPLAFQQKIPYILFGMEDVQAAVIDYVFPQARPAGVEAGRPPTPRQKTLGFLKVRSTPRPLSATVTWPLEMKNYHASVRNQLGGGLFGPLQEIIARADNDPELKIPIINRLHTAEHYGSWQQVIDLLGRELDWRLPEGQKSLLHTSCKIEPVKDYCQYMRFKNMRSVFFPQSLVELSASVFFGLSSRDYALEQAKELGYIKPPEELKHLLEDLEIDRDLVEGSDDEKQYVLADLYGL